MTPFQTILQREAVAKGNCPIQYCKEMLDMYWMPPRLEKRFVAEASTIPYTRHQLIGELNDTIAPIRNRQLDVTIQVFYTVEWAILLKAMGFTNVTLTTLTYDDTLYKQQDIYGYKYKTIEALNSMEFEVKLGNPPWKKPNIDGRGQGELDRTFYTDHFSGAPYSICIMSSSFLSKDSKFRTSVVDDPNVSTIKNTTDYFDVKLDSVAVVRTPEHPEQITCIDADNTELKVDRSAIYSVASNASFRILDRVATQLLHCGNLGNIYSRGPGSLVAGRLQKSGEFPVVKTIGKGATNSLPIIAYTDTFEDQPAYATWKLVYNAPGEKDGFGGRRIAPPNTLLSNSAIALRVDSEQQAINVGNLIASKLYSYIIKQVKPGNYNGKGTFEHLPLLDLDTKWTDEALYALFELTDAEIAVVERVGE